VVTFRVELPFVFARVEFSEQFETLLDAFIETGMSGNYLFELSSPSTLVAVLRVSSPAGRLHMNQDISFGITVIAVFAPV